MVKKFISNTPAQPLMNFKYFDEISLDYGWY